MSDAEILLQELTDLLIENGCTVNKPAMIQLGIYVLEREKKVLDRQLEAIGK